MSRQRIRTGVLEGSTVVCPHCQGSGVVRSTASIALHVLRVLEDALIKSATHDITMRTRTAVALYILNQKRANLRDLERRFGVAVVVEADDSLTGANYHAIERGEPAAGIKSEAEPPKSLADDFAAIVDEPAPVEEDFGGYSRGAAPGRSRGFRDDRPRRRPLARRSRRRPEAEAEAPAPRRGAIVWRKPTARCAAASGRRLGGGGRNRRRPPGAERRGGYVRPARSAQRRRPRSSLETLARPAQSSFAAIGSRAPARNWRPKLRFASLARARRRIRGVRSRLFPQ